MAFAPKEAEENIAEMLENCMQLLREECSDSSQLRATLETLQKILRNVLDHPDEEKYRSMKTENKTFNSKVWRFSGSQQLLLASGWAEVDGHVVLTDDSKLRQTINFIGTLLRSLDSISTPESGPQSPEEKSKQLKLDEDRRKQQEEYKKMMREKKRISDMIKADRRETDTRKATDSHATHLDGSTGMKRYEDIGIQLNKGGG